MPRPAIPAVLLLAVLAGPLAAQAPAPNLVVPPPQAPTLSPIAPAGLTRGTKTELTLTGTNLDGPVGILAGFPAKATFPEDANNGKEPGKLRVVLDVPADAPVGVFPFRIVTRSGVSPARPIAIDELPTIAETDANRTKAGALALTIPCAVVGRADAEMADFFKMPVKAGQRLTFEVVGRRRGSAFDPALFLHDAKTGRPLPGVQSDDAPGLQGDARLTHTFAADGEVIVELRDSTWKGGADYLYRLRIGDFPAATCAIPAAVKRGAKASLTFAGPGVEGVPAVEVTAPTDPCATSFLVTPKGANGLSGWPVAVLLSDHDELVETEPNEAAMPQRLPVPCGVTGRFLAKGDTDSYVFAGKKGVPLTIEAQTGEILSPADVFLTVKDAKGAELARGNPQGPTRIDFNPPADGDFVVTAEHLNFASGPLEAYRLTITPTAPALAVTLLSDRVQAEAGGVGVLAVQSVTRRGFNEPVELTVSGPAGVVGSAIIPAGPATPPTPPPPPPPPGTALALIPVTVPAGLAVGAYPLKVTAKAMVNGQPVTVCAEVKPAATAALAALPVLPPGWTNDVALAVTQPAPFSLAVVTEPAESFRTGSVTIKAKVTRSAGFAEDVALAVVGLPAGTAPPALPPVPKDKTDSAIALPLPPTAPTGAWVFAVVGRAKAAGRDVAVTVPVTVSVLAAPFAVSAPAAVTLAPGGKVKVPLMITRKAGYAGPIELELRGLPAGVTAPKVTIAANQAAGEVELTAAANAAVGKADVTVGGTGAGSATASPAFAVTVAK